MRASRVLLVVLLVAVVCLVATFLNTTRRRDVGTRTIRSGGHGDAAMVADTAVFKPQLPTIFIGIASYKDEECPHTLLSAFEKAKHPERVYVGLVQQNDEKEDVDCVREFCRQLRSGDGGCYDTQIQVVRIDYLQAEGPTVARHIAESLYEGQDFVLQIDSHIHFIPNWDQEIIVEWELAANEMAILTHYPPDYDADNDLVSQPPGICYVRLGDWGLPISGHHLYAKSPTPTLIPSWAAGFSFGRGHSLTRVPNDPYTPFLFHGEELVRAARLWTSGYDFYTPHRTLVTHHYERPHAAKYWQVDWDHRYDVQLLSVARIKYVMGRPTAAAVNTTLLSWFDLGEQRTVEAYWEFVGVDWISEPPAFRCDGLEVVPYTGPAFDPNTYDWRANLSPTSLLLRRKHRAARQPRIRG